MRALVIPEGVVEIADDTFSKWNVPDIGKYEGKSPLTGVKLPSTLTRIGIRAFRDQTDLTGSLDLPGGLTAVYNQAFYNTSLTGEVVFPESCSVFGNALTYGTNITKITVLAPSIKDPTSSELFNPFGSMPELQEVDIRGVFF
jgi:hypothetical protein